MINPDEYVLASYRRIAVLDKSHDVTLVQHVETGRVFVMKVPEIYNAEIYRYLRDHRVKGTPEITDVLERGGRLVVIEEYVSGQTLQEFLDSGNRFPETGAAKIVIQLCRILEQLHDADPPILHRDIKPSNIMLTPDGNIKLLDMNAARRMVPEKTQDTFLIGTVGYAAPEQYGFGASGIQTDIYAAGVLLCELATGRLPKENPAFKSHSFEKIVRKCTQIEPKTRYKSARSLREELEAYCSHSGGTKPGTRPFGKFMLPGFRSGNPVNMLTAAAGYVLLIYLSLTFTAKDVRPGLMTAIERILLFAFGFGIILFSSNYLDIWFAVGISRIKNVFLRTLTVLIVDAVLGVTALIIMIAVVLMMG